MVEALIILGALVPLHLSEEWGYMIVVVALQH